MTTREHTKQIIREMKDGIEFTQVCSKFYSNKSHPFGQRVFPMTRLALNKMLEEKIIYKEGQKLFLSEDYLTE